MDSNGLRSFGLRLGHGLYVRDVEGPAVDGRLPSLEPAPQHRVPGLRLASAAPVRPLVEALAGVDDVVVAPSIAIDADGNALRWNGSALVSTSALADRHGLAPRPFALPPGASTAADLALGDDGVLYLAASGALWMVDLRGRFETTRIEPPAGFVPQRLAARPGGGVWVLDLLHGAIARHTGRPAFTRGLVIGDAAAQRFAAAEASSDPSRWWLPLRAAVPATPAAVVPDDERPVAIAVNARGDVALLSLLRAAGGGVVRLLFDETLLAPPLRLQGPRFPVTLGWLGDDELATAADARLRGDDGRLREAGAWAYALAPALRRELGARASGTSPETTVFDTLVADGDYRPLTGWTGGPFCNAPPGQALHYPRDGRMGPLPARLARIARVQRLRYGWAANVAPKALASGPDRIDGQAAPSLAVGRIDSQDPATTWHRLHIEAVLPAGSAIVVWLAASAADAPAFAPGQIAAQPGWHPHAFGDIAALPADLALPSATPRGVWQADATELPLGRGLLGCPPQRDRCGCFGVLVQRAGLAVRSLVGARLWVVVECFGDGRSTPELVALRVSAGRVSYRDRYLPALYHERAWGADADRAGAATGPDFLDRLLHLFEGLFTRIEDRVAAAALMTDAHACPREALPWLAAWIGLAFDTPLPEPQMRRLIAQAGPLARAHGTLHGLQRMLDLLTDGAITGGRIVVVEDYRLRRTLATILGADLVDHDDPLTAGLSRGGRSVVGETLFLADEAVLAAGGLQTFLALFRRLDGRLGSDAGVDAERVDARRALFDDLAHRVTVLVHETVDADEFGRIERLVTRFAPAHVLARTVRAPWPFIAGVASLVGADSFLRAPVPMRPVRLHPAAEGSTLGGPDTLHGEASLDAHAGVLDGVLPPAAATRPLAAIRLRVGQPDDHPPHQPLVLDGDRSTAAPGCHVQAWAWRLIPPR